MKNKSPRILLIDVETSPLEVYCWDIWNQNIGLNQIIKDWSILSFAAKWLDEDKMIYMDTSKKSNPRDDKQLVREICKLLDQADFVVSHYGKSFDIPKIEARRLYHDLPLFHMPKHEDTKLMSKKAKFTSHKLEYLAKYLGLKVKKLVSRKFAGMELWKAVLNKSAEAWKEMKLYNITDVVVLELLYKKLRPRASAIDMNMFLESKTMICVCGSTKFKATNKWEYRANGKKRRFKCMSCGRQKISSKLEAK